MNKRALALGLIVAILASAISQALLHGQKAVASDLALYIPYFLSPLIGLLIQATSMLAWAIPGFYVGYLSKNKPVQHGAILGAAYGLLLGAIVFAMRASEINNIDSTLMVATSAITQMANTPCSLPWPLLPAIFLPHTVQISNNWFKPFASLTRDRLKPAP